MRNIYQVSNHQEIIAAINSIRNGEARLSDQEIKHYFHALANCAVRLQLDHHYDDDFISETGSREDIVDVIDQFVQTGCKDDFLYIRKS